MRYSVDNDRLLQSFLKLTSFDSESYGEREVGEYVTAELKKLGLQVRTDTTDAGFLERHPGSYPNIYAVLPGTGEKKDKEPLLLAAHLDTVSPGRGKKAAVHGDGTITSDGTTVLGADDAAGIASILEALASAIEKGLSHPDIEVLITPAEETFCEGSEHFDYSLLRSKKAIVLDLDGPVGTAANTAPTILSLDIEIIGRAAHAGFAPEDGINALSIAVEALSGLPVGRLASGSTVNFGTIEGGTGKNIVPGRVRITGEVRSHDHSEALRRRDEIFARFEETAKKHGAKAVCGGKEHIRAYLVDEDAAIVKHFYRAAAAVGAEPGALRKTYGGSDANRLNEHGIESLVAACAMENVHTTAERTNIKELAGAAELTLALIAE